jgi:hypothetical protein
MYHRHLTTRERAIGGEGAGEKRRGGWFRVVGIFSFAGLFLAMAGYLFSVNRNAVAGYSMRIVEKRMTELSNESQRLRIREAALRSLYGLEEASARMDMKKIEGAISIDEPGPVAYGK